jgi:hypothetical protein
MMQIGPPRLARRLICSASLANKPIEDPRRRLPTFALSWAYSHRDNVASGRAMHKDSARGPRATCGQDRADTKSFGFRVGRGRAMIGIGQVRRDACR